MNPDPYTLLLACGGILAVLAFAAWYKDRDTKP